MCARQLKGSKRLESNEPMKWLKGENHLEWSVLIQRSAEMAFNLLPGTNSVNDFFETSQTFGWALCLANPTRSFPIARRIGFTSRPSRWLLLSPHAFEDGVDDPGLHADSGLRPPAFGASPPPSPIAMRSYPPAATLRSDGEGDPVHSSFALGANTPTIRQDWRIGPAAQQTARRARAMDGPSQEMDKVNPIATPHFSAILSCSPRLATDLFAP